MQELANIHHPDAELIRVVLDYLNTHNPTTLYEVLSPVEARTYLERLEFHFTPKHGSWLSIAGIEISALKTQCLNRRVPHAATLRSVVAAWETARNEAETSITRQFTTEDVRMKLHRFYPTFQKDEKT